MVVVTVFRSGLHSANAHSSIVEQLISKAEWFFPGGMYTSDSLLLFSHVIGIDRPSVFGVHHPAVFISASIASHYHVGVYRFYNCIFYIVTYFLTQCLFCRSIFSLLAPFRPQLTLDLFATF